MKVLRFTIVGTYGAEPDHYDGCQGDAAKMAALDQESLDGDVMTLVDLLDGALDYTVKIEPA